MQIGAAVGIGNGGTGPPETLYKTSTMLYDLASRARIRPMEEVCAVGTAGNVETSTGENDIGYVMRWLTQREWTRTECRGGEDRWTRGRGRGGHHATTLFHHQGGGAPHMGRRLLSRCAARCQ